MHRECATGFRRIRPRRSYKNFGLFCLAHRSDSGRPYPCLACRGQGRIDDPADPPCPVEGYKHVRRIQCPTCQGTGQGTKEACRRAYRESVKAFRAEKQRYDRLIRLRKAALARLTKDEITALRELGV